MNSNNRRQSVLSNPLVDLDEQIFEVDVESGSHSSSSEDHKEEVWRIDCAQADLGSLRQACSRVSKLYGLVGSDSDLKRKDDKLRYS